MATVVSTRNPLWTAPYDDPDAAAYGELPTAREWEIRIANATAGAGALVLKRTDVSQIVVASRTGQLLDLLQTTTSTTPDSNVSAATYSTTNPTGYSGNSLEIQATGGSSTDRGCRKTLSAGALDLSVYGGGTLLRIHRRCTSVTNLVRWVVRFEFATSSDWAEFELFAAADTINTWAEVVIAKGNPRATNGTVNWALFSGVVRFFADVSGAYTGNLEVRDLRIGLVQTAKDTPDGYLVWEASYDARARYHDDATPKLSTTLAAASSASATNVKLTSVTGLAVNDWLTIETAGLVESRQITVVGTAGSGGSGITVSEGFTYAHGNGDTAKAYYWGAWSSWLTVKVSQPPVVAADTPADAATVTDPTPSLAHTYSSPASKAQASRELRLYQRVGGVDQLIRTIVTTGTGLTDTLPRLLLTSGLTYAWELDAFDTDGLHGTTTRRTFVTSFSAAAAIAGLTATQDAASSSIALAWTASVDGNFDHYRVYWRDAHGVYQRIDGGPAELDDGRTPLTAVAFTHYGARLGVNEYIVTQHNGALESAPTLVSTTLEAIDISRGNWAIAREGDTRFTFGIRVNGSPRARDLSIETFRPPGRGSPVHLLWGLDGQHATISVRYRPAIDGDLATLFEELGRDGLPFYLKAPAGYVWDPLRARVLGVTDAPEPYGWATLTVEIDQSED